MSKTIQQFVRTLAGEAFALMDDVTRASLREALENSGDDVARGFDNWYKTNIDNLQQGAINYFESNVFKVRLAAHADYLGFYRGLDEALTSTADQIDIEPLLKKFGEASGISPEDVARERDVAMSMIEAREATIKKFVNAGWEREDAIELISAETRRKTDDIAESAKAADSSGAAGTAARNTAADAAGTATDEFEKRLGAVERKTLGRGARVWVNAHRVLTIAGLGTFAASIYEYSSGGQLTQGTVEGLMAAAEYAKEHDIPGAEEIIDASITAGHAILGYMGWKFQALQNGGIAVALGDGSDEEIQRARELAIQVQVLNAPALIFDFGLLLRENKIRYSDLPLEEQDRLLAESVLQNITNRAQFNALKDHPVDEEFVKGYLAKNRGFFSTAVIPERIRTAMAAAIPELKPERSATETSPAATAAALAVTAETEEEEIGLLASARRKFNEATRRGQEATEREKLELAQRLHGVDFANMSGPNTNTVSSAFSFARDNTEKLGLTGMKGVKFMVVSILAGIVGFFNEKAGKAIQRWAIDEFGINDRLAQLDQGFKNNEVATQFGDSFGIGRNTAGLVPAPT